MDARVRALPAATVARLPRYLEALTAASDRGERTVASVELARSVGLNPAIVRKDLSFLGTHGTRGVGYDVAGLAARISSALGRTAERAVVIVGAGNLGTALARHTGFARSGFTIAALCDAHPAKVGRRIAGLRVDHIDELPTLVDTLALSLAVLAVPAASAVEAAARIVDAGITAILDFSAALIDAPPHVVVRRVDLATELQVLSFYGAAAAEGLPAAG
jgi:redox-sensing transcriptional repressor